MGSVKKPAKNCGKSFEVKDYSQYQLLNSIQAAEFLGLSSKKTLETWRWRNIGPAYVKLGKLVKYRLCDLVDFVNQGLHV